MQWYAILLIILGVTIVPYYLGHFIAKSMRLTDEIGNRLGIVLTSLAVGLTMLYAGWPPKYGIDLQGGVILVYEVDAERTRAVKGADREPATPDSQASTGTPNESGNEISSADFKINELVDALVMRLNQGGVEDLVVRPYGDRQVEVIVPQVNEADVQGIKKRITEVGYLEFRIVANSVQHAQLLALADEPSQVGKPSVRDGNRVIGEWVVIDKDEKNELRVTPAQENKARLNAKGETEILMAIDPYNVQGKHLRNVRAGFDENGTPNVSFAMTMKGANLFGRLTGDNLPNNEINHRSQLGIIMDRRLISAPNIQSRISEQGQITGRFTEQEVDDLAAVLNSGRLPAVLKSEPISETKVSPLLGLDTIAKGKLSIGVSLVVVLLFVMIYYRFAGLVAGVSLLANLLLLTAVVTIIKASLTMPGLAGLVLTVGMSVDANVLIFERIREELKRGSALRLAIRNGFARATTTIVDSNVTTLITGIVLYVIGTDMVKGFAVTLILGIAMSMFTAIFCARVLLDIAERKKWITTLHMTEIFDSPNFNLLGMRNAAVTLSVILMVLGVATLFYRGSKAFDTDFNGGTRVQVAFTSSVPIAEVKQKVAAMADSWVVYELNSPGKPPQTEYIIDTSEPVLDTLKQKISEAFRGADQKTLLVCHALKFEPAKAITSSTPAASTATPGAGNSNAAPAAPAAEASVPSAEVTTEKDFPAGGTPSPPATEGTSNQSSQVAPASDSPYVRRADLPPDSWLAQAAPEAVPSTPGATDATATLSAPAASPVYRSETSVTFDESISLVSLEAKLREIATGLGFSDLGFALTKASPGTETTTDDVSKAWKVQSSLSAEQLNAVLEKYRGEIDGQPVWYSSSMIGSRVAGDMKSKALAAFIVSCIGIMAYIWVRFHRIVYGLAAVAALAHDALITIGAIVASVYLAQFLGFLLIEEFKISLTIVAAVLTVMGYSLNDTIVIFDRIREVKGRSPVLTEKMINDSVNQTLGRTLLTSLTTLISVVILYFLGGEGIHGFSYALIVGVIAGTYSSVFIAAPVLLWLGKFKYFQ